MITHRVWYEQWVLTKVSVGSPAAVASRWSELVVRTKHAHSGRHAICTTRYIHVINAVTRVHVPHAISHHRASFEPNECQFNLLFRLTCAQLGLH